MFRLNEALATPSALEDLPPALEAQVGRAVTEAEILAWLTLAAAARRDGRPLLRPVVHGFVRGIGGAVVSFPDDTDRPRLWLAAEDDGAAGDGDERLAQFPVATCTVCGQHYYIAFLRDFTYTGRVPGGGDAGRGGLCWERQEEKLGGRRVVLVDSLIGDSDEDEEATPHARTAPLHFCRGCGAAHPTAVPRCRTCGRGGDTVRLYAVRQNQNRPGRLTSCLSCGSTGRTPSAGRYREPARPVRAINVADVHVLAQDMVHHAERPRLMAFCDNRQDAAFQAGWMKDHARRFRLRALMVCIYLDGLSAELHGDPQRAEHDREIRTWLRNRGYEVIEITANELDDEDAMARHFRRLAGYLSMPDVRSRMREDRSWFRQAAARARPRRPRLRLVTPAADARYVSCVPLVPLEAAAGAFGDPQAVPDESAWEWVEVETARSPRPGMFVARVVGRSMEPRIPDGAYCLFAGPVTGTRQGRIVLVQLRDEVDPDTGERFTVKRYRSERTTDEGGWRHVRIMLEPINPDFGPIVLTADEEDSVTVVAELIEVIESADPE